ncbi:MAG: YihY/virulence factor BrkB family protein [Chitinophagaceae bacterium]
MTIKHAWHIFKKSGKSFFTHNILKLSASLAFFTVLALPGILIIIIWFTEFFYGKEAVENSVFRQIEKFIGNKAAENIQQTLENAAVTTGDQFATIVGMATLVIAATSVFSEIQDSINHIWQLKSKPKKGKGWLKLIIDRLLSFSMIITLGFILLVSLVINGTLDIVLDKLMVLYPNLTVIIVYILNIVITYLITAFIFAAIFKVLPDARIKWRHVWVGAFVTALLFMAGRFLISYFLGQNRMTNAYGAAGYVIVVLLWVYYSSMILYLGAAFTSIYVLHKGNRIYPSQYAVWVELIEVESNGAAKEEILEKKVIEALPQTDEDIERQKEDEKRQDEEAAGNKEVST